MAITKRYVGKKCIFQRYVTAYLVALLLLISHTTVWAAEPLRLSVSRTPLSLTIYVADAMGYFKAEGSNRSLRITVFFYPIVTQFQQVRAFLHVRPYELTQM
jgi:hypothetical protein